MTKQQPSSTDLDTQDVESNTEVVEEDHAIMKVREALLEMHSQGGYYDTIKE